MLLRADRLAPPVRPQLKEAVQAIADDATFDLYVYEGYRSEERSDALYAQGRTAPGPIVTNAKGGQSPHNFGAAADVYPYRNGKPVEDPLAPEWAELGRLANKHGLTWGGDFRSLKDKPHVELPDWRLLRDRDRRDGSGNNGSA